MRASWVWTGILAVSAYAGSGSAALRRRTIVLDVRANSSEGNSSGKRPWWKLISDTISGTARRRKSLWDILPVPDGNITVDVFIENSTSLDEGDAPGQEQVSTESKRDSIRGDDGNSSDEQDVESSQDANGTSAEGANVQTKNLLLGAHHKTGSVLAGDAVRCFDRLREKMRRLRKHARNYPNATRGLNLSSVDFLAAQIPNVTTDVHWSGPVPDDTYVVHFVRNTAAVAVSAYNYHKHIGENWTRAPGSALEVLSEAGWFTRHTGPSESYTDFLRRVPVRVGMHAELWRLQHEFNHMINASAWCTLSPERCREVCLEQFTVSTPSYQETWAAILDFAGVTAAQVRGPLMECLRRFDLHNETIGANDHVTTGIMTDDQHAKVLEMEAEMDRKYFGGAVGRLAAGQYQCSARPSLSKQPAHDLLDQMPKLLSKDTVVPEASYNRSSRQQWFLEEQFA